MGHSEDAGRVSEGMDVVNDRVERILFLLEGHREDWWPQGDRARALDLVKATLAWRASARTSQENVTK